MIQKQDVVVVYDCGSTNLRVLAINPLGDVVAQRRAPNSTKPQPGGQPDWRIWDLEEIWKKLCRLTRGILRDLGESYRIAGAIITTWGADGVFVDEKGNLTYPAISWQCPRTREVMQEVREIVDPWEVFKITGYQFISFNTLFKWIWIRKNAPEAIKRAKAFLMIPNYLSYKLTGEFHVEPTDASTTMAMDLAKRDWSDKMLSIAEIDRALFPEWREPGDYAGYVTERASRQTGLRKGLPVIVGGHDTQFAIFAAGAQRDEAVLSSGTWEILSFRSEEYTASKEAYENGVVVELDVERNRWNPQFLMVASAVLEWLSRIAYPKSKRRYELMVQESSGIPAGSDDVILLPSFFPGSGPTGKYGVPGAILGLTLSTTRAHLYRAALEGLSYQLRLAIELLERSFNLTFSGIRVVGGGSRNELWNRIRASVTGKRIIISRFMEATALGAAIVAFKGVGLFKTFEEARRNLNYELKVFEPEKDQAIYERIYTRYLEAYKKLSNLFAE
ncbi:MAG: FGGY family carbohydrate kinase [Nitrososphaerota archaeon]